MDSACNDVAPLPPYQRLLGPITQARILRLLFIYLTLLASGSALLFLSHQQHLQILGLGMILPGGGFLAHADIGTQMGIVHIAAAITAAGAFVFSVLIWFATGNILAPPLTWLGMAFWAASMRHGAMHAAAINLVYGLLLLLLCATSMTTLIWFALARRERRRDNAYLASQAHCLDRIFTAKTSADDTPEMSLDDLQRLRFALDRALQPVAQFNGFEELDQFQTAATRYQVNFLAYGIALTQARYTPAFDGYMSEAQIALLDKQVQHQVWKYWWLENLWGNLRWGADPLARENIMYTGFVALQMALFRASTGRSDFSDDGRFTLTHPSGARYAHNAKSLQARLQHEYHASAFYLIACEPNWVYPLCNTIGASAMRAFDTQYGENTWSKHAGEFRRHLETEFLDGFGRYVPCRSARTGLALPAIGGAMPLAMPCFFLNALAPDLARRQWLLLRRQLFDRHGQFRRRAFWPIDTGNYGYSRASAYAATALAAAELGDDAVYAACLQALEAECPSVLKGGVIHRRHASVWAHGVEIMARAGRRDGFRDLITKPPTTPGIRLTGLKYPDVLVASAHADSEQLQAVLYAGVKDGIHVVSLSGLQAHQRYRLTGAVESYVIASAKGDATFDVMLAGRSCLHVQLEGDQ